MSDNVSLIPESLGNNTNRTKTSQKFDAHSAPVFSWLSQMRVMRLFCAGERVNPAKSRCHPRIAGELESLPPGNKVKYL